MITISNLSIHYTGENIFDGVSFMINERDRIGLVGKNGAGKTTLLNLISGKLLPESGDIAIPRHVHIGYLPQEIRISSTKTIYNEALSAFDEALELEKQITELTESIASRTDYDSDSYAKIINQLNEKTERFELIGGNTVEADIEKVLLGLGFERNDLSRPMNEFSGGWQMRVELAKILLRRPELVLLDEPTNHLDIESIQWLEQFLKNYAGAVILVSHDRAFLDGVTNRTIEIILGKIYDYKANYSRFVELREERRQLQIAAQENQAKEVEQIQRFIERFRYKNTKAKQVQSRVKMLEKMDDIEVDDIDMSAIDFYFPPAPRSGKVLFEAKGLSKRYGDHLVLDKLDFAILRQEFVAFVGRNGEGKSTLSKIIVGELNYEGKGALGYNVSIGYFAQNQAELLDQEKTVFQTIDDAATGEMRSKVRKILGNFLFSGEEVDKKVKVLSGGEKSRLALAKMLLTPVNLLVLDEPTNHLDMQSKDILKNALLHYDGTLIVVSHDRDFLQGLTHKVFEFRNHNIREYIGDIYDFLDSRKIEDLAELEVKKQAAKKENADKGPSDSKKRFELKKEKERRLRKVKKQIEAVEEKIGELEAEVERMDHLLSNPDQDQDTDKAYKNYGLIQQELEVRMEEWEAYNRELENIENENPEL